LLSKPTEFPEACSVHLVRAREGDDESSSSRRRRIGRAREKRLITNRAHILF